MKTISRVCCITGAAGSIGSSIAKNIVPEVDALILIDTNYQNLLILQKEISEQHSIIVDIKVCDVGSTPQVENALNDVINRIGPPTILINCAGIGGPFNKVNEVSDNEWYQIINTNLKGVFNLCRFILPKMKQHHYGRIINIASVQGYLGAALSSTYVASKHGVIGYTRAIAAEWGLYGITCNAICPGYVDTQQGVQNDKIDGHQEKIIRKTPNGRIAAPIEIASIVIHLVKKESAFINGSVITVDGGLTCHVGVS